MLVRSVGMPSIAVRNPLQSPTIVEDASQCVAQSIFRPVMFISTYKGSGIRYGVIADLAVFEN